MAIKERFDIIASSLSSYFGVGFNTIQEQLDIDLGLTEKVVDDEAQDRMDLGNAMEDACLNYFQKKLGIVIDERNSEYKYACDGKLKCKRDGRTFIDGVETGVENKYSNSTSECFTDSLGYKIQCQAYMMAWGLDQWLLCGMWQGKPAMKIIKKDEEMQKDIETIVEAVVEILMGMREVEDYPWEIVEKYSKQVMLVELNSEDIEDYDKKLLHNIAILKDKKKAIEEKLAEYEDYAKKNYADCKYSDSDYNFTISTSNGRKTFDKNTFSIEHPTIDVEKYYKEGSPFRTIRVTKKKGK